MPEFCNKLQDQYKKSKNKAFILKVELERMEKMSYTSFLMGSSPNENEVGNHLVNETERIFHSRPFIPEDYLTVRITDRAPPI